MSENNLLKQLVQEMREKMELMRDKIVLLEERSMWRNQQEKQNEITQKSLEDNCVNANTYDVQRRTTYDITTVTKKKANNTPSNYENERSKTNNKGNELIEKQASLMKDLIYINNDKQQSNESETVDWKTTENRRKKNKSRKVGNNENHDDGFSGVKKMAWLYVNRIPRSVNCEIIKNYLSKKLQIETNKLHVKELSTKETQNKCFMVGADYTLIDELYSPDLWPKNVGFRRFDFKKYNRYQSTGQGEDFL